MAYSATFGLQSIPIRFIIIMENIAHAIKIAVCLANIDQYRHTEHFIPALNRNA